MAGTLLRFTFRIPEPCPPLVACHTFQVIPVTVTFPVEHPTVIVEKRMWAVEPGPQDSTAGTAANAVVVVERKVVEVASPCVEVVELPVAVDPFVDPDLEPTAKPIAIPPPREARTRTAMPTRTTVLRRRVMTRESLSREALRGTRRDRSSKPSFKDRSSEIGRSCSGSAPQAWSDDEWSDASKDLVWSRGEGLVPICGHVGLGERPSPGQSPEPAPDKNADDYEPEHCEACEDDSLGKSFRPIRHLDDVMARREFELGTSLRGTGTEPTVDRRSLHATRAPRRSAGEEPGNRMTW